MTRKATIYKFLDDDGTRCVVICEGKSIALPEKEAVEMAKRLDPNPELVTTDSRKKKPVQTVELSERNKFEMAFNLPMTPEKPASKSASGDEEGTVVSLFSEKPEEPQPVSVLGFIDL